MKNFKKLILVFVGMAAALLPAYSQELDESLFIREIEIENPTYMPVLGIGTGYFNFYGNVNDAFRSYTSKPGIRVNLAGFIDRKNKYFRWNFVYMMGELTGNQYGVPEKPDSTFRNLNFKSNISSFGINIHYSILKPWMKKNLFEPFISAGFEMIQFDSKADYLSATGGRYYYWTDGTIRDASEELHPNAKIITRDYNYETNLRKEDQTRLGQYNQFGFAIPVDVGIDFNLSSRVALRAATSLHYAFTDHIDDMSSKSENLDYKGTIKNNIYTFTYVSLHWDLFSPPRTKIEEDFLINLDDFDYTMMDDEDFDGVLDGADLCPGTPEGVAVDENGCPFDSDGDGVPDYMDREPNSRPGAIVDEYGVEINENTVVELLNVEAIRRSDVESYLMMHRMQNRTRRGDSPPIPEKFKKADTNNDGYISFDELLKSINDFFDDKSDYSPDDIKEMNEFFFEQ